MYQNYPLALTMVCFKDIACSKHEAKNFTNNNLQST